MSLLSNGLAGIMICTYIHILYYNGPHTKETIISSQGMSDACIAWRKALRKIWKLSPVTHCDVVALIAERKPLEVSLRQRFCKFSAGIDKYGSDVLKTVVNVSRSNPFSVHCNNYLEISGMYDNDDLNVFYNMIMNNWCNCISGEWKSYVSILRDMIDIRDGVKDDICIN